MIQRAVYKFHPLFRDGDFKIWLSDRGRDFANASIEGGDVMPIGNGTVLIGMGSTTYQAVGQVARSLFKNKAVTRVIGLPDAGRRGHALDTVFSFCDRDVVTLFAEVVDQIRCYSMVQTDDDGNFDIRPETEPMLDIVAKALGVGKLRVVETGGNAYQAEREQWDGPATTSSPWSLAWWSVMTATPTQTRCCAGGHRGHHRSRFRTRPRSRRQALHDMPDLARPRLLTPDILKQPYGARP